MEPIFLTAIQIHEVRHLKDIKIPLSLDTRKNLILTGKNGSGKTSLLESIAQSIMEAILRFDGLSDHCVTFYKPSGIEMEYHNFKKLQDKYYDGQFILAYFQDRRIMEVETTKNIVKVDLSPYYEISDRPARDLAKYMVNLKTTQAFALNEGKQPRAEEIGEWFRRFENILRTIYEDNSLKLNFDIENFQFTITIDGREPFDFNTMSAGYAAVFDIIGNLMMRMESQRRYDLEGIVLIDEIETHLHVELQKKIVPILKELFPNIQFIMTTHSPFVLNSAENAVIYDLEKKMLVKDGLTNLPYEGIVEGYFGADRLSQELRDRFDRYRALAAKEKLTDEEYAETADLETYLDEVPDYLALDIAAEYSRLKLELENREALDG